MTTPATTSTTTSPSASTQQQQEIDRVLSSAMLVFGITGSGKTSLLITLMEYVWATYHKVSLLYVTDGGGIHPQLQALVNRGIVRIWRMRTRSGKRLAFETCQRASQGYWPARINPRTGETDPAVKLVAPLTTIYEARCSAGHLVAASTLVGKLMGPVGVACPTCKIQVTTTSMHTVASTARTKGFEQVGAVFYDGLSSQCAWMMDDLGERAGKNELGGEKGNLNTVHSGDEAFGATNRGAYGMVQTRAEQMVLNSNSIPDLVIPPTWTALTLELSDEGGLSIKGPLVIGQAKTATIGEKFGDTLEAIIVERERKKYRQLRLQQWIDDKGARHLCQVRSYPGLLPAYLEDEEMGQGTETNPGPSQPFEKFSLGHFYQLRNQAKQIAEERIAAQYADAPGLPEGDMEYGEAHTIATSTQPITVAVSPSLSPAQQAAQRAGAQKAAPPAQPASAPSGTNAPAPGGAKPATSGATPGPGATPTAVGGAGAAVAKPAAAPVIAAPAAVAAKAPAPVPAATRPVAPTQAAATPPAPGSAAARAAAARPAAAAGAATPVNPAAPVAAPSAAPLPPAKGPVAPPPGRRPQ